MDLAQPKNKNTLPGRRDLVFLFLALLVLFSYAAPRWNDWNQNSRLSLVRSIVEDGSVRIDRFQKDAVEASTGDFAFYQGHYYSDKPPGVALVGVIPYATLKLALDTSPGQKLLESLSKSPGFARAFTDGSNRGVQESVPTDLITGALGRILLSILLVAIPVSLMLCLFWRWSSAITGSNGISLGLTLGLALGTTLFPYGSMLYNHALTAALLFTAFYLLYGLKGQNVKSWQLVLVGFLFGYSLICQYETALIIAPLGLYALFTTQKSGGLKRILWIITGALPPLLAMVIYDLIAFGTPMPVGYQYSILWLDKHNTGFMSLTFPHLDAIWGLSFSPYRGLFLLSPFLLLAFPGWYFGLKRPGLKLEAGVSLFASVAFFIFNTSSVMWWGGHAFGPRYLVSALPFMAFGVVLLLREAIIRNWPLRWLWFWLPVSASILIVFPVSWVGRKWPSEEIQSPLTEYLWPGLLSGDFAPNPGFVLGLKGPASYIPLILILGLIFILMYAIGRKKPLRRANTLVRYSSLVEIGPVKTEPLTARKSRPWLSNVPVWSIVILLIFSSLPYLFGYLHTPAGKVYSGIMLDVPDTTQYWAWLREFKTNLIIQNPLTPEANDPVFFNLLWLVLARLQVITGLGTEWIYQLFRVASIGFFGWIIWKFCAYIFERPLARNIAYLLIIFGSGWGWLPVLIKQFSGTLSNPLAVFVAEPNSFLSSLAFPHLIFSAGLVTGIFWLSLLAGERKSLKPAFGAAILALVLGLEHTYDLIIVYSVIGLYWLWRCKRQRGIDWGWFKTGLIIALISSPPSLYSALITMVNPTWKGVLAQYGNAGVFTPDPLNLLVLIGPLLLLAFAGLSAAPPLSSKTIPSETAGIMTERLRFIKVWFVAGCFLIYLPTNFQIKMLNGWQIPIALLAVAALLGPVKAFLPKIKLAKLAHSEKWLVGLVILIALPTTLYLFSWRFVDLNRGAEPYYLAKDEVAALDWLANPPEGSGVVLSSENLGQYLAARTSNRPFLAHWAMTLDFFTKRSLTTEVFNPATTGASRSEILKKYKVKYILLGSVEKRQGLDFTDSGLKKVFSTPQADIYFNNDLEK